MNSIWLTAGAALVVVGAAVAGASDVRAGSGSPRVKKNPDLVVTLVTPTTNQEVLPDLRDPGLNNVITVRFSAPIRARSFISNSNVFNRLRPEVEFLDDEFNRLPGTPSVRGNVFRFDPRTTSNGGILANGQYTLNIKAAVMSVKGKLLNHGLKDFTTTFSVGTDIFSPVLRKISPIQGQTNIGLSQKIVATFNEPINPSSLLTTITVSDVGTSPPTPILGVNGSTGITTDRNGFDVVFTPDPCFGYPPKSTIQFQMQGKPLNGPVQTPPGNICGPAAGVAAVSDYFGNQFTRDAGLQWTRDLTVAITNPDCLAVYDSPNGKFSAVTGIFTMQFQTRGIVPPPVGLTPGSSQFVAGLCPNNTVWSNGSCANQARVFFYTTGTSLGEVDITGIISLFSASRIQDFSRSAIVANSPVRMGRPGGMMVDPRWDANNNNHTFIYLVDQRSATVLILDSRSLKVLGRFAGFSSPRDLGMSTDFRPASRITLMVVDFGARQCVAIDLSSIAVRLGGQPGALSPCDAIKDNVKSRVYIPVGNGPSDMAGDSYLLNRGLVVNSLDSSVTLIDSSRNTAIKDYQVGGNPLSCDFTLLGFGFIDCACIANQGGLTDLNGSISMYLRAPPLQGFLPAAGQNRDGIESNLTDGVKNPTYVWGNQEWANIITGYSSPNAFFVPNTGGKTMLDLRILITGVFGLLINFQANQTREVGFNPTGAMYDPYYPNADIYACVAGEGQFVGMDALRNIPPQGITVPGIRRIFTCYSH